MSERPVFSPKLLAAFAAVAIGAFALSLYFLSSEKRGINDLGPTTYSRSAIGYAGLAELLRKLGIPFIKSESNSVKKAKGGLLIVAEPRLLSKSDDTFRSLLAADRVLVVLPKWSGTRSRNRPSWVEKVTELPSSTPQRVLDAITNPGGKPASKDRAELVRVPKVETWSKHAFPRDPSISGQVQLIKGGAGLLPVVWSPEGVLVGEIWRGSRRIWVLSDPDVLSNHGLGEDGKRNAVLAVSLINKFRGGGPAVFDETVHGFISQPAAPWRMMFQFPFAIVTLQGALAVALLLWATMGRFGPPSRDTPPLAAGKHGLIDNVARLMGFAGYQKLMLRRYVEATIRDAAHQLHAPKGMTLAELTRWMERTGKVRGVSVEAQDVLRRAEALIAQGGSDPGSSAGIARDIYRWKGEMLNGPSGHSRDH